MAGKEKVFRLLVRSREGVLYDGDVTSATSINDKGKFDILAQHTNFISLIDKYLRIVDVNGEERELNIDRGVLRVLGGRVEVYLGIEGPVGQKVQTVRTRN